MNGSTAYEEVLENVQDGERKFKMQQFLLFSKCWRGRGDTSST
jgi:hypothetical protein